MKGNKGEWSEPYVLIKLLADGELKQGTIDQSVSCEAPYNVVGLSRHEKVDKQIISKLYERVGDNISIICNDELISNIPIEKFSKHVSTFFEEISSMSGSCSLSDSLANFLKIISVESVKADSKRKADIEVLIHDHYTSTNQNLGFSVKSQLGSPSSLVNASQKNTNFRYRINGNISAEQIATINSIKTRRKVKDRIEKLEEIGAKLEFESALGDVYTDNLLLIDRDIAKILSECLLHHYSGINSSMKVMCDILDKENPLGYPLRKCNSFYEFKLKRYLSESALGMIPASEWSGKHHATGGYIVVKSDGELISYHLLRKNLFEDYLLNNTKFESPSTSRHDYGKIYKDNDNVFINLNLQIRFTQ